MLRKILLSTAIVAAAAGSAAAADLPYRSAAPAPYVAAPIFTWTGFYVGLNAGAGFNNKNNGFTNTGFGTTTFSNTGFGSSGNSTAFTGGAQAGYNMQFGSFVAGIEADINYLDRGNNGGAMGTTGTSSTTAGGVTTTTVTTYSFARGSNNNYFGTVRGRLGIAFDRFLPYITGGFAFGGKNGGVSGTTSTVTTVGAGAPTTTTGVLVSNDGNGSSTGYALGGGMEYAFSNNMSFKVEYLHVSLGTHNRTLFASATPTQFFTFSDKNKFDVVRAGVNFRF